jgi:hypothetical protein
MTIHKSFSEVKKLKLKKSGNTLDMDLKEEGGLYCLWLKITKEIQASHPILIQGPYQKKGSIVKKGLEPCSEDFRKVSSGESVKYYSLHRTAFDLSDKQIGNFLPVYIGKSTNIKSRIGQHIMVTIKSRKDYLCKGKTAQNDYEEKNNYSQDKSAEYIVKRNTSSQFRAGLEYLFKSMGETDAYEYIWTNAYLSVLYESDFKVRFYSENYLIGKMMPLFNIDGER